MDFYSNNFSFDVDEGDGLVLSDVLQKPKPEAALMEAAPVLDASMTYNAGSKRPASFMAPAVGNLASAIFPSTSALDFSDFMPGGDDDNHDIDFDHVQEEQDLLSSVLKETKKKSRKRSRIMFPKPARLEPKKVGILFVPMIGNENFLSAGPVRKDDSVSLRFHEDHEVWEVLNREEKQIGLLEDSIGNIITRVSQNYKILQECKMKDGNDGLMTKASMIVRVTILAAPFEVDDIEKLINNHFNTDSRLNPDVFKSARRKKRVKPNDSAALEGTPNDPWKATPIELPAAGPSGMSTGDGVAEALSNENIFGQTEEVKTLEEIETDLDKLFSSADHENLPEASTTHRVKTKLYSYQKQGLYWMQTQESVRALADGAGFLGWKKKVDPKKGEIWYNRATRQTRRKPPERWRGGILADEMGLGKTLQIISIIASTARDGSLNQKGPRTTLIICPLSVITNWEMQCKRHIRKDNPFRVHTYHGPNRFKKKGKLKACDVIITTYQIVKQEFRDPEEEKKKLEKELIVYEEKCRQAKADNKPNPPKPKIIVEYENEKNDPKAAENKDKKGPLYSMTFLRIVLDEAHIIRDRKTRQCRACLELKAERRWCITGTPFQNKVDDAYSLLAFLRVEPFTNYQWWTKLVTQPLKNQNEKGMKNLQKIMSLICLRRKKSDKIKGKNILPLPPKKEIIKKIILSESEQKVYKALASSGKRRFKSIMSKHSIGQKEHFAFVLQMLLRMRQACDDINLVPTRYHNGFLSNEALDFEEQILTMWEENTVDECAVCYAKPTDPCMASNCGHMFCKTCITEKIMAAQQSGGFTKFQCPACDKDIERGDVITHEDMMKLKKIRAERDQKRLEALKASSYRSTKTKVLIQALQKIKQVDPTFKAVIFSQFTSMLDIVYAVLVKEGYRCSRIDGRMSSINRKKNIQAFAQDPTTKIFLISLKAGGMGLNLTAANTVFLLDPWWNPAAEDQAVARIHRCGQSKPVNIIRFITNGTVEEKILDLQKTKREMMVTALKRFNRSRKQMQAERLKNLKTLFR
mmetsp:Transcript_11585/g.17290  ORF Transcript_11585/g.17290 Transcript_11585/m.17290 type:complete len:1036 (-) Transcript_11585:115-3222(-)